MAGIHKTGQRGEAIAAAYLSEQGYEILATNWQSNHQEVDIVARKAGLLVIAEVKTRSSSYHGQPEAFVTRHKQRMLIKAANHYLSKHKLDLEVRFDIVAILIHDHGHRINHIESAFYPTV